MPESSGVNESYQWGPNGHPQLVTGHYAAPGGGGSTYTESVHWDGDAVAFTSQNSSAYVNQYTVKPGIDKVFIGDFAEYFPSTFPVVTNTLGQNITSGTPQTLSVTFRDPSGGYVPITSASSNSHAIAPSLCLTPQLITPYINVVVCQPRNDGWQIGMTTFQGVRSYDASAAQWTTPDAYAGDVHDPMTQQKYMWNNNNPVKYSDPSGYEGSCNGCEGTPADNSPCNNQCRATAERNLFTAFAIATVIATDGLSAVLTSGEEEAASTASAAARGAASERRALDDLGLPKNTQAVTTSEGRSIPDALTKSFSVEIKDTARVSATRQVRIQTDAAKASGRESILVTGINTKVTQPAAQRFDQVIRRPDLGPPQ